MFKKVIHDEPTIEALDRIMQNAIETNRAILSDMRSIEGRIDEKLEALDVFSEEHTIARARAATVLQEMAWNLEAIADEVSPSTKSTRARRT